MVLFNSRFVGFVFLSTFDELRVYKAELEHMQWLFKNDLSLSLFGKISLNEQWSEENVGNVSHTCVRGSRSSSDCFFSFKSLVYDRASL